MGLISLSMISEVKKRLTDVEYRVTVLEREISVLKYKLQYPQQQTYQCSTCGQPLRYLNQNKKWYCDTCRKYVK